MFRFVQTEYGLRLTAWGAQTLDEIGQMRDELARLLTDQSGPFSGIIDTRGLIPAEGDIALVMEECERMALDSGMERMAIIINSPVIKGQLKQVGHLSGTASITRYIDASKFEGFEQVAVDWAAKGIEPLELSPAPIS